LAKRQVTAHRLNRGNFGGQKLRRKGEVIVEMSVRWRRGVG